MKKIIKFLTFSLIIFINNGVYAEMNTKISIETSMGVIKIELYNDKAPITSQNFIDYIKSGYFSGTIFHRVIKNFMIQGGGFTEEMQQKETQPPINNEADNGVGNKRGTIAMARTTDPHSATAQFFINLKDNDFLNFNKKTIEGWGYCVFGIVYEGLEVIDKIAEVKTGSNGPHQDVPETPVIIDNISIEK